MLPSILAKTITRKVSGTISKQPSQMTNEPFKGSVQRNACKIRAQYISSLMLLCAFHSVSQRKMPTLF